MTNVIQEQARKERLSAMLILGVCILAFVAIVGAAMVPYIKHRKDEAKPLGAIGVSAAEAKCDPITQAEATGTGDHKAEGTKISYPGGPPASGAHWGTFVYGPQLRSFYTREDRPPVEQMVHSLEHGHTLIWYDESITPGTKAYADLKLIAKKVPESQSVIALPWDAADGDPMPEGKHLALTHWTGPDKQQAVRRYCAVPSAAVVSDFVKKYDRMNAPEPGAA